LRKAATFLDTAAAIRQIQTDVGIRPENTVFFGRSAGGWLAANIAQDHGDLVAAVYAEVPYVDVLATTSNPKLPLTQLEYDEFGDPAHRPAEKEALARISPVDTVPAGGPTSPLVVIRTGLHDAQVFPYEALKWSRALRSAGWTRVYVGIDHNGGHFAGPDAMLQQRAEDAALLDSAVIDQTVKRRRDRATRRVKRSKRRSVAASSTASGKTRRRR
jgi:oligopeptidase B